MSSEYIVLLLLLNFPIEIDYKIICCEGWYL